MTDEYHRLLLKFYVSYLYCTFGPINYHCLAVTNTDKRFFFLLLRLGSLHRHSEGKDRGGEKCAKNKIIGAIISLEKMIQFRVILTQFGSTGPANITYLFTLYMRVCAHSRAVQLTVFQLIINGNKFVTFNRTNRLITAVISDPLHSL